jgi:hypothetical protein
MVALHLLLAIVFIIIGLFVEQKYRTKKIYTKFINYISTNENNWQEISNEIVQKFDVTSLNEIVGKRNYIYLIIKEASGIRVQALNNEKHRIVSEPHYKSILKKIEKQDMFYTFNIDTGSIYYRFSHPNENCILWINVENAPLILYPFSNKRNDNE